MRDVLIGVANAFGASATASAVLAWRYASTFSEGVAGLAILPVYGAAVFSWYILPLGILMGLGFRRLVRSTGRGSVLVSAVLGLVLGALSALVFQLVTDYWPTTQPNVHITNASAWWQNFWRLVMEAAVVFSTVSSAWCATAAAILRREVPPN